MKPRVDGLEKLEFERAEQKSGFLKTPPTCKKLTEFYHQKGFLNDGEILTSSRKVPECM